MPARTRPPGPSDSSRSTPPHAVDDRRTTGASPPRPRFAAHPVPIIAALALALALPFAAGCGVPGADAGAGPEDTAQVSLFVTDAPSDAFLAVNVTVTEIALLGGPRGPVTLFEGRETFDLLALRDVSELFAVDDAVPAGRYTRLRLRLAEDGLELVEDDGRGGRILHHPTLPPDGVLHLLPRPAIAIGRDEAVGLEIDVDVDRSVWRDDAGVYHFRPVVLVRVLRDVLDGRLVRLHGFVTGIDVDAGAFSLCRLRRPLAWLDALGGHGAHPASIDHLVETSGAGPAEAGLEIAEVEGMDARHPWRRCVDVNLTDDASLFDVDGTPIRLADVTPRERATVVGRIRPTRDRPLEMFAPLVWMGPPGTFERRVGVVTSGLDADGLFGLSLASGRGDLAVRVFPTTKIFERGGLALGEDAIAVDARASVTGVIVFPAGEPAVMNAAVLVLDLDDGDPVPLRGDVTFVDPAPPAGACALGLDVDGVETGVAVGGHTVVFVIDASGSESMIGTLEDIAPGDAADVYGRPGDPGEPCFRARVIVAFPAAP